ncbi:RNA-binding domain-containing protein [Hesseltinella vesiculosa]|uniref:RNA-binding domain-containing protein n=1 Tax=Hesseltinella vesiculosa TaxID=101127 RepID=A0A1X2GA96_9FUNG|nr:RNA-binding domain-containing protein [Hesseltinella vesiculosa]
MNGSRSRSRSPSRSPARSMSRSRSPPRSRSRSRSPSRSRSRSRSPPRRRRRSPSYSRSRSRSISPRRRRRSPRRYSRSPVRRSDSQAGGGKKDLHGTRDSPEASNIIGVFGLNRHTRSEDLEEVFAKYGRIQKVTVVYDHQMRRSRGFGFINFENEESATAARTEMNGRVIDGRSVRVDYSITHRAHSPTPGEYMGERRRSDRDDRRRYDRRRRYSRSRSPPRRRRRSRSRSWSR